MPELPVRALAIYLMNRDLEPNDIISKIRTRKYRNFDIGEHRYHVYAKPRQNGLPSWASFFEDRLDEDFVWPSSSPGVVLLLDVDDRKFAVTFGQGRHLLNPDCWEDRFGLKVVLNTVDKVKSLAKQTFDAILRQSQIQANAYTEVHQFGFDVEQDLLRAVTGQPSDTKTFGERLTGSDALSVSVRVDLAGLPRLLSLYLQQAEKTDYRDKGFKFVDHMRAIQAPALRLKLEVELVELLKAEMRRLERNAGTTEFDFDLVIPKIVDWEHLCWFRYDRNPRACPDMYDIAISSFLPYMAKKSRGILSVDGMKRAEIVGMDGDGREIHAWRAYKCLVGDLTLDGKKYVLSDGNWYEINQSYAEELDAYIGRIDRYPEPLPPYVGGTEGDYNEKLAATMEGYYCFDKGMLHPQKGHNVEFCDVYSELHDHRNLIHVKRGKSSAVLSHLFNQGITSAEVYTEIVDCREQAEKMVETMIGAAAYTTVGRPERLRTVYAIIRPKAGRLPFFSKVNLKRAHREIRKFDMDCALAEIEHDPAHAATKKR